MSTIHYWHWRGWRSCSETEPGASTTQRHIMQHRFHDLPLRVRVAFTTGSREPGLGTPRLSSLARKTWTASIDLASVMQVCCQARVSTLAGPAAALELSLCARTPPAMTPSNVLRCGRVRDAMVRSPLNLRIPAPRSKGPQGPTRGVRSRRVRCC